MRIAMLAAVALTLSCASAAAEQRCPELTRMRGESTELIKKITAKVSTLNPCEAYTRFAILWKKIAEYADEHRKACGLSDAERADIESRHIDAVKLGRDNCIGRRPDFPADIQFSVPSHR
jgi:hypothetical protein